MTAVQTSAPPLTALLQISLRLARTHLDAARETAANLAVFDQLDVTIEVARTCINRRLDDLHRRPHVPPCEWVDGRPCTCAKLRPRR